MITIQSPHMGLNDARAPVRVQMWQTWEVGAAEDKQHIIDWVAHVARGAPGGKLKELEISCHGAPGFLQLGQGFATRDVGLFRGWRGLIDKIWIRACFVARVTGIDTPIEGDGAFIAALSLSGDGDAFLRGMAEAAQAYVVAGTELQTSRYSRTSPCPYGRLDSYEGLVLSYPSNGGAANWSHRYPSVSRADPVTLTAKAPNRE